MITTLFVEVSMCPTTFVAGWGAVAQPGEWLFRGPVLERVSGSTTAELAATSHALAALLRGGIDMEEVQIALRSTAALAVLRWVFPEAPQTGELPVIPPKRLGRAIREYQPLYDLHDDIERAGVRVSLLHTPETAETRGALDAARFEMARVRGASKRGTAR